MRSAAAGRCYPRNARSSSATLNIKVTESSPEVVRLVIATLERLGAPKGSTLTIGAEKRDVAFGTTEGLAVYLNGTDLPAETYRQCDSNFVYSEFGRLLEGVC